VGTVWGAKQVDATAGIKLAVVRSACGEECLAADTLGANIGETVLVANGSRIREIVLDSRTPVKTLVVGIVDTREP
jgi:ethanolamine utilization protein EutN